MFICARGRVFPGKEPPHEEAPQPTSAKTYDAEEDYPSNPAYVFLCRPYLTGPTGQTKRQRREQIKVALHSQPAPKTAHGIARNRVTNARVPMMSSAEPVILVLHAVE